MSVGAPASTRRDVTVSTIVGLAAALAVIAGIYFGSRRLKDFDAALVAYAGASVFSAFGLGYRYAMWLRRPPTRLYWWRGWQLFTRPAALPGNLASLAGRIWNNIFAQTFIEHRSFTRWATHALIFWGCLLAAAVTFPLSFGWIRFENARDSQQIYEGFVFGVKVIRFPLASPVAPFVFDVLDIAAVLVIAGVGIAMWRRARDRSSIVVQQFANDLLPLLLLFAISVTGILLTVSTHWLRGMDYGFLSELHAVTVIFTLLYLPFGKFFHIFQRPAQLAISYYKREGQRSGEAPCVACGGTFASKLHVEDLKKVEAALGIQYGFAGGGHYQDVCPSCRRKTLGVAQDALWRAAGRGRGAEN